ncbi:MAG: lysylphosphatidylglycerol synthase transmembrane domain-containing protein [Patescibacteria group bacterium]|jgi:hypothetical protein
MKKAKIIFIALNVVIIGFLIYFLSRLDYATMGRLFRSANLWWLLLGIVAYLFSLYFKIARLGSVTNYFGFRLPWRDLSFIQMTAIAIAMMTPGRLGEASKIYLLHQKSIPAVTGTAATIFERIFDFLFLSAASIVFVYIVLNDSRLIWLFSLLLLLMLGLLLVFRYISMFIRFVPIRWRPALLQLHDSRATGRLRAMGWTTFHSIATWSTQAMLSWATLAALGVHVSPLAVIGVEAIGTLAAIFSFLPLGLGAMDLSMLFLYGQLGIANEPATIVVFLSRTIGFLAPLSIALILTNLRGMKLSDIKAGMKQVPQ